MGLMQHRKAEFLNDIVVHINTNKDGFQSSMDIRHASSLILWKSNFGTKVGT